MSASKKNKINNLVNELLKLTSQEKTTVQADLDLYIKINEILEKVKKFEPDFDTNNESREEKFKALMDWVQMHGGSVDNISIDKFEDMEYGLKANMDLAEGEIVCSVPKDLFLTTANVQESPLRNLYANDLILKTMDNVALALFLIMEYARGKKSLWHNYIASLPRRYNTILYFSIEELMELKGSPTLEPALTICKSIARQYAYFKKLFSTSNDEGSRLLRPIFSYKLYCWGVSTVMTRQNCIPNHDAKITNALIPLWDMCNHSNGKITTGFNKETNKCECLALKNFKKGDQIFIFYGARTNAEFLLHNGFVYAENEYDSYRLRLGLSKADALYELRASVLSRLNLPPSGDFYLRRSSEPVDGELLAFLRVFNMEEGDLKHWLESSSANNLKSRECILDLRIENKAWNYLAARINLLLISYANITENCNGNLEVSDARRMIRLQKKLEKNILTETLSYVQQHLKN